MREATIIINKSVQSQAPRLSSSVGGKNQNLKREKPTTNTQKKGEKGSKRELIASSFFYGERSQAMMVSMFSLYPT
jgi:hypothetical protein